MSILRVPSLLLLCCVACGSDGNDGQPTVNFSGDSASAIVLGPNDVKVTSTDGALVLAVVGDSVRMQLSDSLRAAVKLELDSADKDNALAATIMKSVGSVVNSALGFVVRTHVDDVKNLRYEDGSIRFDVEGGNVNLDTGSGKANNTKFAEADAHRFIEAVQRRQQAQDIAQ